MEEISRGVHSSTTMPPGSPKRGVLFLLLLGVACAWHAEAVLPASPARQVVTPAARETLTIDNEQAHLASPLADAATEDAATEDAATEDAATEDAAEPGPGPDRPRSSAWSAAGPVVPENPVTLSDWDRGDVARVLCGTKAIVVGPEGYRCACPSSTEFRDVPGTNLELGPFFGGHFSGPSRTEVVIAMRGCETGAGSSQTYGERALVRRTPSGWEVALQENGALGECTAIVSSRGRSRLVCRRFGGHMGIYTTELTLVDFDEVHGRTEQQDHAILAFTTPLATAVAPVLQLTRYALLGNRGYEAGRPLAIEVTLAKRSGAKGERSQGFALRYEFDGDAFHLATASRASYEAVLPLLDGGEGAPPPIRVGGPPRRGALPVDSADGGASEVPR